MSEIEEFHTWRQWVADFGRCQAVTRAGHQCKNKCHGWGSDICNHDDFDLVPFIAGVTDRCRVHVQAEKVPSVPPYDRYSAMLDRLQDEDWE